MSGVTPAGSALAQDRYANGIIVRVGSASRTAGHAPDPPAQSAAPHRPPPFRQSTADSRRAVSEAGAARPACGARAETDVDDWIAFRQKYQFCLPVRLRQERHEIAAGGTVDPPEMAFCMWGKDGPARQ